MGLPEQEWFTIGELAQRWETSENRIEILIEAGKLQAEVKGPTTNPPGLFRVHLDKDAQARDERIRADRLKPRPLSYFANRWPIGNKVVVLLREVERFESENGMVGTLGGESGEDGEFDASTANGPDEQSANETAEELRDRLKLKGLTRDQMIYEMREIGFSNNEIGVALGGAYREGSNALAMSISKVYNKQKKS